MVTTTPNRPDRPAGSEQAGAALASRPRDAQPAQRRDVMGKLLGDDKLAAMDVTGGDPYNATGRFFRR